MFFVIYNLLPYIHNHKLKMAKEVNIVVLCNEIFNGLEAKGCGMSPIKAAEGGYNGTFVNIVFDALEKAKQ